MINFDNLNLDFSKKNSSSRFKQLDREILSEKLFETFEVCSEIFFEENVVILTEAS